MPSVAAAHVTEVHHECVGAALQQRGLGLNVGPLWHPVSRGPPSVCPFVRWRDGGCVLLGSCFGPASFLQRSQHRAGFGTSLISASCDQRNVSWIVRCIIVVVAFEHLLFCPEDTLRVDMRVPLARRNQARVFQGCPLGLQCCFSQNRAVWWMRCGSTWAGSVGPLPCFISTFVCTLSFL